MAPRTVYIWDNPQVIDVSETAEGAWIAQGNYRGEVIIVQEVDDTSAIKTWLLIARRLDGNETPQAMK